MTPALRREIENDLGTAFERAKRDSSKGLRRHGEHESAQALPQTCLYSLDQIISHNWHPKNRHGIVDAFEDTA